MSPPDTSSASSVKIPVCHQDSGLADQYALMFSIRLFEQSLLKLFEKNQLRGTTHTCLGQESTAVGVISNLNRDIDVIFSNHRGHGHFLSYCGEMELLYLELMGHPRGVCGGLGGSQHLHFKNFYSNGIQGGIVPNAVGMAKAQKLLNSEAVVVVFLGDGTMGQGVVYESFNLAALWKAPVFFVLDNNHVAQSTPVEINLAGDIARRPAAFGIPTVSISGRDVEDLQSEAFKAVRRIRRGKGPQCLVIDSVRLGPHSKGDDSRLPEEIEALQARDPVALARDKIGSDKAESIETKARRLVQSIIERVTVDPIKV